MYFYPRPPRGGRRIWLETLYGIPRFLSTPSARRATTAVNENFDLVIDFYPRPPRGGRQTHPRISGSAGAISIHALREEGDWLSSLSARRWRISIHALREEGDNVTRSSSSSSIGISIHALREEGDLCLPLLRGEQSISIHALREEGDPAPAQNTGRCRNFYPRPPRGGRQNENGNHC